MPRSAVMFLRDQEYQKAAEILAGQSINAFLDALQEDTTFGGNVYLLRGLLAEQNENWLVAIENYEKAKRYETQESNAWRRRFRCYSQETADLHAAGKDDEAEYYQQKAEDEFKNNVAKMDLRLMPDVQDLGGLPKEGDNLAVIARLGQSLHFRVFDYNRKKVADVEEKDLPGKVEEIKKLRNRLESLWPPHELNPSERNVVISAITSIVGEFRNVRVLDFDGPLKHDGLPIPWERYDYDRGELDLKLLPSAANLGGLPDEEKKLVVVAQIANKLHFRIFDGVGKKVVDTDEQHLPAQPTGR